MPRETITCKSVVATVDWITATASSNDARERLWNIGQRVLHAGECEGERAARWHANGYDGWAVSHAQLGSRRDSVIIRLGGEQARDQWRHAFSASENVSRLDLAIDCELDSVVRTVARDVYNRAAHARPSNGRKPKRTLIVNGDGGATAYIGSRVSEQYGRVYDKGIEAETHPAGARWRFEVEYKGSMAQGAATALRARESEPEAIVATVADWWLKRSHTILSASGAPLSILHGRRVPPADRRLTWLARGVRPTVRALVDVYGRDRILCALGLLPQSAVEDLELPTPPEE